MHAEGAGSIFFKAIEIDPGYGKAYAKIAFSHTIDAWLGWSADAAQSLAEANKYATLAIKRDDDEAWGALGNRLLQLVRRSAQSRDRRNTGEHSSSIRTIPTIMNDFGSA
ncbi:MAG: hypothetical protein WDN31_22885 [Hyphomicrobium sp.]